MGDPMVPVLRFPQFDKNWFYVTMETLFPKIRNGFVGTATPFYVINGVKYLQGKNIKHGQIIDKDLININQSFHQKQSKSILKKNDLVMVQSGHVGECAIINDEFHNSNCHALLISSPIYTIESIFYKYFFYSESGKRKIYKIKTGNTIEHILSSDLKKITIPHPAIKEQQKIADFLSSVDKKIQQLTRKKELLEKYKTGMMQKLFPKAGEQHPELRFKDENGQDFPDWESKNFNEIFYSVSTKKHQIKNSEIKSSGLFKVVDQSPQLVSGYSENVQKLFDLVPAIIFGDHTTIIKFVDFPFIIGADGTKILKIYDGQSKFQYYNLMINNVSQEGYKRHFSILKGIELKSPIVKEQQKIADFLSAIDDKITKVEGKLTKAQTFKKGLLQQMFV